MGRALTNKRFETLYKRLRQELSWVAETGFTGHWLRHTTLTWCERSHGQTNTASTPTASKKQAKADSCFWRQANPNGG